MELDLLEIHSVGADGLGHPDALALDAGSVGGDEAVKLGADGGDHVVVRAEAAGGDDDSVCIDGVDVARVLGLYTDGSAVFIGEDFGGGGVGHEGDAALFQVLLEQGNDVGADGDDLAVRVTT